MRKPHFATLVLCFALSHLVCSPHDIASRLAAADFNDARESFFQGRYEKCIELTSEQVEQGIWNDFWSRQLMQALLTTGKYGEAKEVYETVSEQFQRSMPLRLLGAEAYRYSGDNATATRLLNEIPELYDAARWRYSDRDNRLAVGRYLLSEGADARAVLESFYDRVLKEDPSYVDGHIAVAELALAKSDFQEAVRSLDVALELRPEDPQISYLLAKAWSGSDSDKATAYLSAALDLNRNHPPSLLLQASELADSEQYDAAEQTLARLFAVNPDHPDGWAMKAAIAHLRGEYLKEGEYRTRGLKHWNTNPNVDFLIGQTLSKHYRFAESVVYQRRSLKLDPEFLPAKFQLAQDLLRVGEDADGWELVNEVTELDPYNVVAYNLKTLENRIQKFTTLVAPGFIVRMDQGEAQIYGQRVLELLQEARRELSEKYEFDLPQVTTVEIFTQQSDFAIRTFGLPGGAGYLGVCFGSLITANSPASQGESPSNWESVLWHEFCHVITLQKTNNRMPRWLSEGISVYEEIQRNPRWGQSMTPQYKSMIQGDDFVPLSELSSAFMRPPSALHLQFAYYESYLAVRYLVEQHGLSRLCKLLEDLGLGETLEEAFARRYGSREVLDREFKEFVMSLAESYAPETEFDVTEFAARPRNTQTQDWLTSVPNSYPAQRRLVEEWITQENWQQALAAVQVLKSLLPHDTSPGGALQLEAEIARNMEDRQLERTVLEEIAQHSADDVPALVRLMELCRAAEDWSALREHANHLLAVQPLISAGHENLAESARQLGLPEQAVQPLKALRSLDPIDPVGLQYELAQNLFECGRLDAARLEVLIALEESPRYRDAQKLLVKIHNALHSPSSPDGQVSIWQWLDRPDNGRPPAPGKL